MASSEASYHGNGNRRQGYGVAAVSGAAKQCLNLGGAVVHTATHNRFVGAGVDAIKRFWGWRGRRQTSHSERGLASDQQQAVVGASPERGINSSAGDQEGNNLRLSHNISTACLVAAPGLASVARVKLQNCIVDDAIRDVQQHLGARPLATLGSQRGFTAEMHHAATFNLDAVRKASALRASVVPGGLEHDLVIRNTALPGQEDLALAQVKTTTNGPKLRRALNDPRYDNMQKVVSEGMENPALGHSSALKFDGVSSSPLSVAQGDAAALDPEAHFNPMRPSAVTEAAGAALHGAAIGALVGGGLELARVVVGKGRVNLEDLRSVGKTAAVCAAVGATGEAVAVLMCSPAMGGLAAGTAMFAYRVTQCSDWQSRRQEVVATLASVVAGSAVKGACGLVLAPLGMGAAVFSAPVVGIAAAMIASRCAGSAPVASKL